MKRPEHPWQLLVLMGSGVFIASFWILFGFLSVLGTGALWWQIALSLAPGGAMLFFVLMARRAPIPYGAGMAVLGVFFTVSSVQRGVPLASAAWMGMPLAVVGVGFILARRVIRKPLSSAV